MSTTTPPIGRYRSPQLMGSSFVAAVFAFVTLNAALSFFTPLDFDPYKFPYKGWAWWLMDDLRHSQEVYNIALLGSSTMVSAITACDANFLDKGLDLTKYHKAAYLDHKLRQTFGGTFNTFSLATPGQMPSDAYLALRAMVNCAQRPDVVVYGIFPRDFIDSTLADTSDTEPFKYLRRLVNIDDVYAAVFRSPLTKLDWWLARCVYLYEYALDCQMAFVDSCDRFLSRALPKPYSNHPFTWWDRVRLMPAYMPGEIHEQAVMAQPVDSNATSARWVDNTLEYQSRYRHPDPHTYRTQINFLKHLARFCHKERIELIVVNMPITLYNVGMLQAGTYTQYRQAMKEESLISDFTYYDLADFSQYRQSDYNDPVHLNCLGGKKFLDHLVETLAADNRSASMLAMTGRQLELHKAVAASPRGRLY
ncbi:MAG: hypothetical protein HY711_02760 [Candidatus Melainabacteria bacterium]|nr:hypothetical protein [Candidatus Melainabacteria bacterium]